MEDETINTSEVDRRTNELPDRASNELNSREVEQVVHFL